jgi:hypothetical protein
MTDRNEDHLPDELQDVAHWLREQRPEPDPLTLDAIKTRAMARAGVRSHRPRGRTMKSRMLIAVLTVGLLAGGTGGVLAGNGNGNNGNGNGNAAGSEYRPGWGCGDQNHIHTGPPGNPDAQSPCK